MIRKIFQVLAKAAQGGVEGKRERKSNEVKGGVICGAEVKDKAGKVALSRKLLGCLGGLVV